ncbi:MAG: Holliday junction branch migration protein RuvA [Streptococcus sp.]|nr:Holliday junction branch migration protein RuvA [Streptococcus sp.]
MFDYIKGILTKITAKYIVIETMGIGYVIHVANPFRFSDKVNTETKIFLHQVIRDDAHLLYGFESESEKDIFSNLISVNGIGPMTALAIIAVDDNEGLVHAIDTQNITYLTKFPKVGKKTAQQMILDLEGRVSLGQDLPTKKEVEVALLENMALEEAMEALLALGYKASELKKIKKFFDGTNDTAENYIKSSLKMLMK